MAARSLEETLNILDLSTIVRITDIQKYVEFAELFVCSSAGIFMI